jgi:hypothetical protein
MKVTKLVLLILFAFSTALAQEASLSGFVRIKVAGLSPASR